MTPDRYEWTVVLCNERQGFQKTRRVNAEEYTEAVRLAYFGLQTRGYDPASFTVIELRRGTTV